MKLFLPPLFTNPSIYRSLPIEVASISRIIQEQLLVQHRMPFSRYTPIRIVTPNCEVIEDSEPEREERRSKKSRVKTPRTKSRKAQHKLRDTSIIELSSDSSPEPFKSTRPNNAAARAPSILYISDDSDAKEPEVIPSRSQPTTGSNIPLYQAENNETHVEQVGTSQATTPSVRPLRGEKLVAEQPTNDNSGEDSPIRPTLNLARFAYSSSSRASPVPRNLPITASSWRSSFSSIGDSHLPTMKKNKALPSPHPFPDFLDTELVKLRKCVCCDLAWTARKSTAQKVKHIQACGKKNKFSDETIRNLIAKEIDTISEKDENKKVQRPKTLLTEAVDGAAPKKMGRKNQADKEVKTIRSLADTRNDILARARLLLDSEIPADVPTTSNAQPTSSEGPLDTEPFGRSDLATKFGGIPLHVQQAEVSHAYDPTPSFPVFLEHDDSEDEGVSQVQPFTESALAGRFQATRRILELDDMMPSQAYAPPSTFPTSVPLSDDGSDLEDVHGSPSVTPVSPHADISFRNATKDDPASTSKSNANPTSLSSLSRNLNDHPQRPLSTTADLGSALLCKEKLHPSPTQLDITTRRHDPSCVAEPSPTEEYQDACQDYNWNYTPYDEDPYLHYISDEDVRAEPSAYMPDFPPSGRTKDKGKRPQREKIGNILDGLDLSYNIPPNDNANSHHPLQSHSPLPDKTMTEPRIKKARKKKNTEDPEIPASKARDMPDEELFSKLRECILSDVTLHHRVLRYEPVHFDVFLQLAVGLGVPARGLKLRVRAFLDRQAIHFYGLDPSGRRTKTRHP